MMLVWSFRDGLVSLNMMLSRLVRVVACVRRAFLFQAERWSVVCRVNIFLSVQLVIHLLAVASKSTVNIGVQLSVESLLSIFFLAIEPEVKFFYPMVILCLTF